MTKHNTSKDCSQYGCNLNGFKQQYSNFLELKN